MPDVVDPVSVLTARKANPPRSLRTHTATRMKVVNSHARVSHVNQDGGGGPRNVFATPPSSYSSKAIVVLIDLCCRCFEVNQATPRASCHCRGNSKHTCNVSWIRKADVGDDSST